MEPNQTLSHATDEKTTVSAREGRRGSKSISTKKHQEAAAFAVQKEEKKRCRSTEGSGNKHVVFKQLQADLKL